MRFFVLAAAALALAGCKESRTADDVKPCVKSSAQTAGTAAKTGGETAVEGVKTLGDAIGGLLEGGKDEAKRRWNDGKQKTKATAKSGGGETKGAARETDAECD